MATLTRRRDAGQILLEVLVALLVTSLVVSIAARLLAGSQLIFVQAAREARDPVLPLVVRQLRHDAQGAQSVVRSGVTWSTQPLVLLGNPQGTIRYERTADGRLERSVLLPSGEQITRDLLHSVVGWRWAAADGLVDLQIAVRRQPPRGNPLYPASRSVLPTPVEELQWLRFALRGGGLPWGW